MVVKKQRSCLEISDKNQKMLQQVRIMLRKRIFGNPSVNTALGNNNKRLKTDDAQNGLLDLSLDNCRPSEVSKYFPNLPISENPTTMESRVLQLQIQFSNELRALDLVKPPIEYVYSPLEYAFKPNEMYIRKYCTTTAKLLFVGINPGPFGMCQTGVPFGDPKWVRDWLNIEDEVLKPPRECPKRPVQGFASQRKEQSGDKLWGLFSKLCGSPENFFRHSFVTNFCPLAFMKHDGTNVTPNEIKDVQDRKTVESICEKYYLKLIQLLEPETIITIGRYMEEKTNNLLRNNNMNVSVLYMKHPSPRVKNNHNWPQEIESFLHTNNLVQYFTNQ